MLSLLAEQSSESGDQADEPLVLHVDCDVLRWEVSPVRQIRPTSKKTAFPCATTGTVSDLAWMSADLRALKFHRPYTMQHWQGTAHQLHHL